MDPFRDELAAAHAKIAQLEERVNYLQNALRAVNDTRNAQTMPPQRSSGPRSSPGALVAIVVGCALLGGASVALLSRGHQNATAAAASAEYKGIATAELPKPAHAISPTVDPTPTSSAKANAKPCNCTPGDPLCTCL